MQTEISKQLLKIQRAYFGFGLLLLSLGIFLRLNAHSIMWAHSPFKFSSPVYSNAPAYSGAWQDIIPFGLQETALIEVSRVLMGFGMLLSLLSLYWLWRFQVALLEPQVPVTEAEPPAA